VEGKVSTEAVARCSQAPSQKEEGRENGFQSPEGKELQRSPLQGMVKVNDTVSCPCSKEDRE
jgi:hypothetical protein